MKKRLLWMCFFLFSSRALAWEGSAYIHDMQITQYLQNSASESVVHYVLTAQKSVSEFGKAAILRSLNRTGASERLNYQNGNLTLANATITYQFAYYFRGQLILEGCRGALFGENFTAKELAFDAKNDQLLFPRVIFSSSTRISAKTNYVVDLKSV